MVFVRSSLRLTLRPHLVHASLTPIPTTAVTHVHRHFITLLHGYENCHPQHRVVCSQTKHLRSLYELAKPRKPFHMGKAGNEYRMDLTVLSDQASFLFDLHVASPKLDVLVTDEDFVAGTMLTHCFLTRMCPCRFSFHQLLTLTSIYSSPKTGMASIPEPSSFESVPLP